MTNKNNIKLAPESIPTSNLNVKTYTKIVLNCFVDGQELSWRDVKKTLNNEKIDEVAELFLRLFAILSLVDAGYSSSNFKSFLFEEELKLEQYQIELF